MIRAHSMIFSVLFFFSGIAFANPPAQNLMQIAITAAEKVEGSQVTKVGRVKCHHETATFCIGVCLNNGNSCLVDMANYLNPNGGVETDPEVFFCHPTPRCQKH